MRTVTLVVGSAAVALLALGCVPSKTEIEGSASLIDASGKARPIPDMKVHAFPADKVPDSFRVLVRVSKEAAAGVEDAAREAPDQSDKRLQELLAERDRTGPSVKLDIAIDLERGASQAQKEAATLLRNEAERGIGALRLMLGGADGVKKTDADGRFTLTVPTKTPLFLVAVTSEYFESTEPALCWAIPIETRDARLRISLSRDNAIKSLADLEAIVGKAPVK